MSLVLKRVRPCDGECCRESPQFPNAERSDCVFRDADGCRIMRGDTDMPDGDCPANPGMTAADALIAHCRQWPHNSRPRDGGTGGCCFQWVTE